MSQVVNDTSNDASNSSGFRSSERNNQKNDDARTKRNDYPRGAFAILDFCRNPKWLLHFSKSWLKTEYTTKQDNC